MAIAPRYQVAKVLYRLGITPDSLTVFGLLLAAFSGWLIFRGELFWAALALLASGVVDMLDGAVARLAGTDSPFGGIFDSSLDRYGDAFVYMGLTSYFFAQGRAELAAFSMSAWIGSFSISYVRARAECEIDSCRTGFWERGERTGTLVIALAAANPAAAVLVLGISTHWTVLQRLRSARTGTGKPPVRSGWPYFLKVSAIVAFLLLVRPA